MPTSTACGAWWLRLCRPFCAEGYPKPYETLKALTRTNEVVDAKRIAEFVETLNVSDEVKAELRSITPHSYTGY